MHYILYSYVCAYPCELDLVEGQRLGLPLYGRHPPRRRLLHLPAARRRRRRYRQRRHGCRRSSLSSSSMSVVYIQIRKILQAFFLKKKIRRRRRPLLCRFSKFLLASSASAPCVRERWPAGIYTRAGGRPSGADVSRPYGRAVGLPRGGRGVGRGVARPRGALLHACVVVVAPGFVVASVRAGPRCPVDCSTCGCGLQSGAGGTRSGGWVSRLAQSWLAASPALGFDGIGRRRMHALILLRLRAGPGLATPRHRPAPGGLVNGRWLCSFICYVPRAWVRPCSPSIPHACRPAGHGPTYVPRLFFF